MATAWRVYVPIEMGDGNDLTPDVIIQTIDAIRVDETIADPAASAHRLLNFTDNLRKTRI